MTAATDSLSPVIEAFLTLFRHILLAAVCAGIAAGAVLTAVQMFKVLPLIAAAETYETGETHHGHHDAGHHEESGGAVHDAGRLTYTLAANVLAGVALALILVSALSLAPPADWRRGMVLGAAGFVAFSLAPAVGLPPGLPGMASAALEARQIWWACTVASTAAGLALLAFPPAWWARAAAVAFIVAPHLVGAPGSTEYAAALPAGLAAAFVSASLAASLVFWLVIGGLGAHLFARFRADQSPAESGGARSTR